MAEIKSGGGGVKYQPYVPAESTLKEFSIPALVLGLILCVVLGAANAYLGLKAGMTIAATYPAAVLSMALLRIFKGTILEENFARTVGSIGESVAAGAIFTIPAFMISGVWDNLEDRYLEATAIMLVGGVMGVLFVTLLRRVMVEDVELPYPESVAAGEIHKAGRAGGTGAMYLFLAGTAGALIQGLKQLKLFAATWEKFIPFSKGGVLLGKGGTTVSGSGGIVLSTPGVSPAYMGVGYIIGPRLASLNFAGGLLAWGLFVPLLLYFLGPSFETTLGADAGEHEWMAQATDVWRFIVRPIAIGGMLMSAVFTLWRMRKNLIGGIKRSIGDVKKSAQGGVQINRIEHDLNIKWVLLGIGGTAVLTFFLYNYFANDIGAALTATVVMVIAGFFFAAVSGYLVGLIGSSNNPISGVSAGCLDPRSGLPAIEAGRPVGGPDLYFDPCSFAVPLPGTIGNAGRNTLIAPPVFNVDVSVQREFVLDSKRRLEFRGEFFNVPNRVNFGEALSGVYSSTFPGRLNPTAGRINSTITTSRQIQFALRFSF